MTALRLSLPSSNVSQLVREGFVQVSTMPCMRENGRGTM